MTAGEKTEYIKSKIRCSLNTENFTLTVGPIIHDEFQ